MGLRQCCVMSPWLCIICMDGVVREMDALDSKEEQNVLILMAKILKLINPNLQTIVG